MRIPSSALALTLVMAAAIPSAAQSNLRAAPSGRGATEVVLTAPRGSGDTAQRVIRLDYGQPHLRGRALHTDSLVPYDKPWRTGANNATTFHTDVDLVVGGVNVPSGHYFVFTVPGRSAWKLILQKDVGQEGATHDPKYDTARIDLRHRALASPLESLTMWLIPSRDASGPQKGELRIAWGTFEVSTDWILK